VVLRISKGLTGTAAELTLVFLFTERFGMVAVGELRSRVTNKQRQGLTAIEISGAASCRGRKGALCSVSGTYGRG
jgi:hypothetical protein